MNMRVLITGSRSWRDVSTIHEALRRVRDRYGRFTLVSGHSPKGADAIAERIAVQLGLPIELHPADWKAHGRSAGFVRNTAMVQLGAEICLAFIHNNSRGASHTAALAMDAGIPTKVFAPGDLR